MRVLTLQLYKKQSANVVNVYTEHTVDSVGKT